MPERLQTERTDAATDAEPLAAARLTGGQLQTALLTLQRTAGNRAVQRLLADRLPPEPPPQPKPAASQRRRRIARATPEPPSAAGWQLEPVPPVSPMLADAGYQLVRGGPPGESPALFRLMPDGKLIPTSDFDELCPLPIGTACYTIHMLRGGPSVMAEQATIDIALMGTAHAVVGGVTWVRGLTNFDDLAAAGGLGLQEGAAESVAEMNPFRPPPGAASEAPVIRFVGLGEDAEGAALVTLEEITQAADELGAVVVSADALGDMPVNAGRLWLGRYGSGAIPGEMRYPGKPGLALLERYAKAYGGRTGAIKLSDVPRADWFGRIQPLIDDADQVMFHASTGVGVIDETGMQFLTNEELMYILNHPEIAAKTTFFVLTPM